MASRRLGSGDASVPVGRIGGAPIRVHWSWIPALGLLVWLLAGDHLPRAGVGGASRAAVPAAVALLALGSVLLHELGRLLAAASAGVGIAGLTLWPTGGLLRFVAPPAPSADVRIAASGPLVSLILAWVFQAVAASLRAARPSAAEAAEVLWRFNGAFGVFNLVPALPLDGGMLARSWLRARGSSFEGASSSGARAGIWFGAVLAITGGARIAAGDLPGGAGLGAAGAIVAAAGRAQARTIGAAVPPAAPAAPLRRALSRAGVGLAMLVAAGALYHPPLALMLPGDALDVVADIEITGAPTGRLNGRYVAPSVRIQDPTALHAVMTLFRSGGHLIPRSEVPPVAEDPFGPAGDLDTLFLESRLFATVAAARAVGLEATLRGTGARVLAAGAQARAAGILPGDVIVAVEGRPVRLVPDLRDAVTSRPAGGAFTLTLERAGRRLDIVARSTLGERSAGVPGLDVLLETRDFQAELPFEIRFRSPGGRGPSGGLAYALAIADLLDPRDLAAGRTIAATGIIDLGGRVAPIVGARAKVDSAMDAGAALFLLPAADAALLSRIAVPIGGVATLGEALALLA